MTADKTLLRMKYADIVRVLAERTDISMEEALRQFYESHEYQLLSRGVSDLHCMTPDYIVSDIVAERNESSKSLVMSQSLGWNLNTERAEAASAGTEAVLEKNPVGQYNPNTYPHHA